VTERALVESLIVEPFLKLGPEQIRDRKLVLVHFEVELTHM